jgi:SAM-dependent methyltransferase
MRLRLVAADVGLALGNLVRTGFGQIPVPPRDFVLRVGGGDYRAVGESLARVVVERGGLRPTDRILDIGCGVGRLAAPLTRHLGKTGSYEGFDIDPELVEWCRRHITSRHPRFHFRAANVRNDHYHPSGSVSAAEFRFPYESGSFEMVVATSVFTHLLTPDAENYLRESARVLVPGGTLLATFFLLDEESLRLQKAGRADLVFRTAPADPGRGLVHHVMREDVPEAAVAYSADWVRDTLQRCGFAPGATTLGGRWCGRPSPVSYQDVVIVRTAATA